MRKVLLTISLVLFMLWPSVKCAANTQPVFHFHHFSAADGLTSNSVAGICVDKSGCIWAATSDGLFRYCGDRFKLIEPPSDKNFNIVNINYMIVDTRNCLWIASTSGIFSYNIELQRYEQISLTTEDSTVITAAINTIAEDKDGNIWFSTYGDGVFRYNIQTSSIKRYTFEGTYNFTDKVFVDSDNIVWVAIRSKGKPLARLNKTTDKFEYVSLRWNNSDSIDDVLTIFEDSNRTLWLGTWINGVQKFDKYTGQVTTYLAPPEAPVMHIHSLCEYQPFQLLIGSDEGLVLFNTMTGGYELFIPDDSNPTSISDKFIYPITKDNEGGLWIGTYYGGINYISPYDGLFSGNSCSGFTNSKAGSIVSCICEADNGDIWLGTDDKGLIRYSPSDGSYCHFMPDASTNSISYYNVHALCFDGDDLWIGTYTGGLNVYNTRNKVFRKYIGESYGGLDNMSVYAIFRDRDSTMWLGTMGGIDVYDRENDWFYSKKEVGGTVVDIQQDKDGYLWFATQTKGILFHNPADGGWKEYLPARNETMAPDKCVNTIYVDDDNTVWAGTSTGLYRYNRNKDYFEHVDVQSRKENICCIIGDNNILWLSTTNGLIRFDPENGSSISYGRSDGLQSDQFMVASGWKTKDGVIYFGSINGFNSFSPYKIKINPSMPRVVLTGLQINNAPVEPGENTLLPKAVDYLDVIDLKHYQNDIIFSYSALTYYAPGKIEYEYRLDGYDNDWNYVANLKSATYTNLSPGKYEFQVRSSNGSGIWNSEYKSIKVNIHPPLLLTPLFLLLYGLMILLSIVWIVFFFVRRSERINRTKMEVLHQKREKTIYDEKIRFLTSIAHEIRTPLSLITAPIERIFSKEQQDKVSIADDLNTINRNSKRLLSLVNQLLDFRKTEQESGITLFFTLRNIPVLINSIVETYMAYLIQYDVELTVKPMADFEAEVDPEAFTKVLSNLLTNAAKYARKKVSLDCTVNNTDQCFRIVVTDDGYGIPPAEIENVFKPFYRISEEKTGTGIGLSIVKSIVGAHNGTVTIDSFPGEGCSFIISMPLQQEKAESEPGEETIPEDILDGLEINADDEKKYTLLIVEDNKEMMVFLYDSLSNDYNVLTAMNGADALELLKSHEVSIIVCDWMMPVMNGVELCKAIRQNIYISHIPFIMLTAKTDVKAKIEGMEAGVDIFIEKPFSINYLSACTKSLLDMRKSMMEKFSKTPLIPLSGVAPNVSNEQFLTQVSDIIEANISNTDLSVDFIVKQMHISRSGFFAKIKTLVDVTPNDLIQIIRLKKAASLMLQNRYLVSEICYMVGFRNPSYFSKCFHKQFGVTPIDFIKNHIKKSEKDIDLQDIKPV